MITLAVETSTARGSVALLDGDTTLFNESFSTARGHSTQLFLALERALAIQTPDQIAVGLGPGSYSGVRIAIAAAIGVSLSLKTRLVGLSSLLAFETDAPSFGVIGDARRTSFYFAQIAERSLVEPPQLLVPEELAAKLATLTCPIFTSALLENFPAARLAFPTAERLARLAAADLGSVARDRLEPLYLRAPHITQPRKPPSR